MSFRLNDYEQFSIFDTMCSLTPREKKALENSWAKVFAEDVFPAIDEEPCTGGYYLRTTQKIPKILEGTQPRIYPIDYYQGINISYVSRDRMRYVGTNKFLNNIIVSM